MALYASGAFGIIQELYVASKVRSEGVGEQLIDAPTSKLFHPYFCHALLYAKSRNME